MESALIIGGASGIGLATANLFITKGCKVFIIDKNILPEPIKNQVSGFAQVDILDNNSVNNILEEFERKHHFEHLVITAGGAHKAEIGMIKQNLPFWELNPQIVAETIDLNLLKQILLVQKFILLFSKKTVKSITLTSSINSSGRYGLVAYSSAKAGLEGFVRSSAEDLGKLKIRINCVLPGSTLTPLTISEGMLFEEVVKQTVLSQVNQPEDIADAISFCVFSPAVTGQCIVCDSGQLLKSLSRY